MPKLDNLIEVKTSLRLRGLHPVLSNWTQAVMDFSKQADHDNNCWWYNERASLSVLAGAAWRTKGWTALEEFSTTKRATVPDGEVDHGRVSRGRCDLHIESPSNNYAIEAKQAWQCIGKNARADRMAKAMKKANKDAGNLSRDEGKHRLGLTFVVPYLSLSQVGERHSRKDPDIDQIAVREAVVTWLEKVDFSSLSAFAFVFPGRTSGYYNENRSLVFPGTLIAIEERTKANKQRKRL